MADALAGRAVVIDQSVIPAKDGCPARFRPLRDDYVASCRARGNAEATVAAKDKAVSRFLGYLDEMGAGDLAALGVRDVSGFLLRQRGLRRKTIAGMRSSLADFLAFLAAAGRTPQSLAGRLPPHRHLRHESEPHLWTAEEIRRLLAVIDRQSATGKRDYAMILMTARLGLRISDLRQLELGDLDWRAKTHHDRPAQDGPAVEPAAAGRRRLGDHRLRPARPPRNRLREGVHQAPPSLRRVRLLLVGRLPAVALRGPRGDRVPARPGVRDAFPARRAGRGHDRQRRADAGDIGRARDTPPATRPRPTTCASTSNGCDAARWTSKTSSARRGRVSAVPETTLPGLVAGLVASRHAGGYRFKVQERVLRQFAGHCRREGYPDGSITKEAVDGFLYGGHLRASTIRRNELALRQLAEYAQAAGLGRLHPGRGNSGPCPPPAPVCVHRRRGAPPVRRDRLPAHVQLLEQGHGRPGPVQGALRRRAESFRGAQPDPGRCGHP